MTEPLLYESHCHTPLCKHAVGDPSEYAQVALNRGLKGMIVTCHNPMPNGFSAAVRMSESEFDRYVQWVGQTAQRWKGRLDVRLGLEADYFVGHESYVQRQLEQTDFQFVLGSVHPQISEYRERFWHPDPLQVQRTYFQHLAASAETGLFDSLAHPDLIKNFTASAWHPDEIMADILRALDRIAATGTAMELNTSGLLKTIPEMNPFPEMLVEISKRGIPITLGADAHEPDRVGAGFIQALTLLRECGFTDVSVFLERKRQPISIDLALASLSPTDMTSGSVTDSGCTGSGSRNQADR